MEPSPREYLEERVGFLDGDPAFSEDGVRRVVFVLHVNRIRIEHLDLLDLQTKRLAHEF